jgi:flagellar basal body-associated protein FliL|tara:strand:+ start:123 stop:362 length:240 start_codon:yes stop_codon:yes gene_type:complete
MSTIITFPFKKKEGKYFAPIVSQQTTYKVSAGAVAANTTKLVSGVKGAFMKVRLKLTGTNAQTKKELYAINSEAVNSSN